jgi:hypothetical protein
MHKNAAPILHNIINHKNLITIDLLFPQFSCKINIMTQTKSYTVDELMQKIYDENFSHFDFMDNMNGGECDCNLHVAMDLMYEYGGGLC